MSSPRQRLGRVGEDLALRHLEQAGYEVLEANYRTRSGEIDLVARRDGALVFVEVRTRRGGRLGPPEESVDAKKQARLAAMAEEYMQAREIGDVDWRIDVVAIELDARGAVARLEVIENAVEL
jgi:putative endonuclease